MAMSVGEAEAAAAGRLEESEGVHLAAARGFVRGIAPAGAAVAAIAPIAALLDLVLSPAVRAAVAELMGRAPEGLLCPRACGDAVGGAEARASRPGAAEGAGGLRRGPAAPAWRTAPR